MELRSRKIGTIGFPMIPEILEHVFSHLNSRTILATRSVCKSWNDEACKILGRRNNHELSWGGGEDEEPNHALKMRKMLSITMNPKLFSGCSIGNSHSFKMARTLFEDFGRNLRSVGLDLGIDFPLRYHIQNLENLYKLVTVWGPQIDWMELEIPIENMKRLSPSTSSFKETYSPKDSGTKVTKLKHLGIYGLIGPFFPEFSLDLVRSSPKLEELVMAKMPPDRWRYVYFGQSMESQRNIHFLDKLSLASAITTKLNIFSWSLSIQMHRDLFFDPMSEDDAREMGQKFTMIQFGQLQKLALDTSLLGRGQDIANIMNSILAKNPNLEDIRFNPCTQDAPLTIVMGNQPLLSPICLNTFLPHLKRLSINSVKGKVLNLFTSLTNFPNLEVLKLTKSDPFHYLFYLNQSCFFRARYSLKDSPHLKLKKLVFEYPFEKIEDLRSVFDSFPNLEHFKTPLFFGQRFLFGPNDIIGDVSFVGFHLKIYNILEVFSKDIKKLKTLQIINHSELHFVRHWLKALKMLGKLRGLQEFVIDCRCTRKKLYMMKLKHALALRRKLPFPIRILQEVEDFSLEIA